MRNRTTTSLAPESLEALIHLVRGERVILDADLARIYGVETRALNQAVRRNLEKFPPDFLIQLARDEAEHLHCSRSQFVILKRGYNIKFLPYVFTEHGAIMAANVLNSPQAVRMSVYVVRAFMALRKNVDRYSALRRKLRQLERTQRLQGADIQAIFRALDQLDARTTCAYPEGRQLIGFGRNHESKVRSSK